jgi:DNA-binding CsgD family transcriptional regulator
MSIKVSLDDAKLKHLLTHTGAEVQRYVADGMNYGIH